VQNLMDAIFRLCSGAQDRAGQRSHFGDMMRSSNSCIEQLKTQPKKEDSGDPKIFNGPLSVAFVRHGESTANAGFTTTDPSTIPLSATGQLQAFKWAESLKSPPSLLVVSPFLRARQTAEPLENRFRSLPMEIWPVQEFTYLSPVKSAGTTGAQRRPRVDSYWARADVIFEDGDSAESFASFMTRVNLTKTKLEELPATGVRSVLCVGHGQFWQALRATMQGSIVEINAAAMRRFKHLEETESIANLGGFTACWTGSVWSDITPA
jgi:2,3-bisphosphoglycerate-dependent phosphoglycerate mutase